MLFLEKIKQKIFNKKIKSSKEIENEISLKTIVEIPLKDDKKTSELIEGENEKSPTYKAFRKMVTNIQFLCVNSVMDKKVMLVTSAEPECGKSYVTANLAIAFSKIGKKVLIIDADMMNGRQDKIFNIPNNLGLSNYLSSLDSNGVEINEFLSKFINETAIKNVNLITAGTVPPNPSELLASEKLPELIKDAKVFFDIILIDSNEVLDKMEALVLSRNSNSTILVAKTDKTSIEKLEKAKRDIQNVGGKVLGVALNEVTLPKEKKTKAQRKEEFVKFRIKVKEKFDNTIETIKRKLNQLNQKLLEAPKEINKDKEVIESIATNVEKIETKVGTEKLESKDLNSQINVENTQILNIQKNEEKKLDEPKISVIEMIKEKTKEAKFFITEKRNENKKIGPVDEEINHQIDIEEITKKEMINQNISEGLDSKEKNDRKILVELKFKLEKLKEKANMSFSKIKTFTIEKVDVIKNKLIGIKQNIKKENTKIENDAINIEKNNNNDDNADEMVEEISAKSEVKNEKKVSLGKTKEKIINTTSNLKKICEEKINSFKNKKLQKEENNIENSIKEENLEIIQNKELKNETTINSMKNEDMILIIIDAENGYCRVFSKDYFVEKLIRGTDKYAGSVRAQYSMRNLRRKRQYFIERYQITEAQTNRIDVLIYDALKDYDEYQWIERKVPSDKAENYALAISKEYEKEPGETEKEYNTRCQRLRKAELENAELNIEYKLDNLWITTKINMFDKFLLSRFAKIYEIETNMKNDSEIMKSKKTKKFYTEIIKGAEKRFEKAKNEDIKREESEKQVVEEDRKIKQEELKYEQQQLEIERKAAQERIRIEQENVRAEKKAEQERIKEEKRKEREIERIERKEENARRKKEKQKQKEEVKFQKERERLKQMEEAKLEEELLEDNLYPKTKNNKNL